MGSMAGHRKGTGVEGEGEESIKPTTVIGFTKVGWRMDHPRGC